MTVFKCKMCGGAIEFNSGETVGVCSYCGTKQTLPRLDDDRRANLYDRANHFRRNNDYDKAAGIYEQILNEDPSDAEAYWSLVLCSYGIEYVEDPATHRHVPTVNRAQFTSVFDDDNYKSAMKNADMAQRAIYESEAAAINEIQKGILAISQKEDPFDVFICYKETDQNGRRTVDSVLAADLYHQLTQEGFKVFFSRITLEDKLGTAYEPYIFAALNSAKVMVVLGTKPEHFKAVWVKNEWSRYLALVKQSNGKKTLIPAYRDMDPYDLPDEFSHLQAQDMSKLGFMQDLIRGIKKITAKEELKPQTVVQQTVVQQAPAAPVYTAPAWNIAPLLKRTFMFLEDGEWDNANDYAERVLDIDPENGEAYLAKAMSDLYIRTRSAMNDTPGIDGDANIRKALRYGSDSLKNEINGYIASSKAVEEMRRKEAEERIVVEKKRREEEAARERAEKERRKVEEKRRMEEAEAAANMKADMVIAAIRSKYSGMLAQSLEQQLAVVKQRAFELENICSGYDKADAQLVQLNAEKTESLNKLNELYSARNSLGLFAGKEKKCLDGEISGLTESVKQIDYKLASTREQLGGFETKASADKALSAAKADVLVLQSRIEEIKRMYSCDYGYDKAVEDLRNDYNLYSRVFAKAAELLITTDLPIFFGVYTQINNSYKTPIEWVVLKKETKRALLISKYAIDCQKYNAEYSSVTWGTCSLRRWLNGIFINSAFNEREQKMILSTTVTADKNPSYGTSPGNDTTDKVFLLSITEANEYLSSDDTGQCQGTTYCYARRAYIADNGNCWWWLRSPGRSSYRAARVSSNGSVDDSGDDVSNDIVAVRPAMWINIAP